MRQKHRFPRLAGLFADSIPYVFTYLLLIPLALGGIATALYLAFFAEDPLLLLPLDLAVLAVRVTGASAVVCFGLYFILGIEVMPPFTGRLLPLKREEPPATTSSFVLSLLLCKVRDGFFLLGCCSFACLFVVFGNDPQASYPLSQARFLSGLAFFLGVALSFILFGVDKKTPSGPMLCLMLFCLGLPGCSHQGLGGSFVGNLPTEPAVQSIAADAAKQLSTMYPPGHTSVFLLTPKRNAGNGFSPAFEDHLRRRGFLIVSTPANAVVVAYTLDYLPEEKGEEPAWYLQLRFSDNDDDGTAFARSYTATGTPEAGHSRTGIAFTRSAAALLADKTAAKAQKIYDSTVESVTE